MKMDEKTHLKLLKEMQEKHRGIDFSKVPAAMAAHPRYDESFQKIINDLRKSNLGNKEDLIWELCIIRAMISIDLDLYENLQKNNSTLLEALKEELFKKYTKEELASHREKLEKGINEILAEDTKTIFNEEQKNIS